MPKVFTSKSQRVGELGETIACRFLSKNGFKVIERNFFTVHGEIDIIAEKNRVMYFIEVKSTKKDLDIEVSHETKRGRQSILEVQPLGYNPADNIHKKKIERILKVIFEYKKIKQGVKNSQIAILIVYIDTINKLTKVEWLSI
jgi:putative endonuclease